MLVPVVGLEPTPLLTTDFESAPLPIPAHRQLMNTYIYYHKKNKVHGFTKKRRKNVTKCNMPVTKNNIKNIQNT